MGFIPGYKVSLTSKINAIHHMKAENALDKIQNPFMIKKQKTKNTCQQTRVRRVFLQPDKNPELHHI